MGRDGEADGGNVTFMDAKCHETHDEAHHTAG